MPDLDKVAQCAALAKTLWFMVPPARAKFAVDLYDLGVRIHPELATKSAVPQGATGMGEHRHAAIADVSSHDQLLAIVRRFAPEMAERIESGTPEQQAAALAEIRRRHPNLIADAEQRIAAMKAAADPETLV
jgi:hypothetical protein